MNKPVAFNDLNYVVFGCGDIGSRVAVKLSAAGQQVICQSRSDTAFSRLQQLGLDGIRLDLSSAGLQLPDLNNKAVFYFIPPSPTGDKDALMENFISTLTAGAQVPHSIVYISTTGVYGDCAGRWINEDEPLKPQADRAKRRLHAEQQLQAFAADSGCRLIILRVAGIYGPDKLPLARLAQQQPVIKASESPYTNRIHADDLVNICITAMQTAENGSVYNVSDGQPGTMADYFTQIAKLAGLPIPEQISLSQGEQQLSAGMMSYMRESRRLDNSRLLDELDITLQFPTLEQGLENCFATKSNKEV